MRLLLVICLLMATGCAEFKALKSAVGSYGSEAADEAVDVAVWQLCNASSVGAMKRRFKTADEISALRVICREIP